MEIKKVNEGELFLVLSLYLCCELVEGDSPEYVSLEEVINLKDWNFLYLYSHTKPTSRKRKSIKIESLVKHFSPRLFQLTPTYDSKETNDGAVLIEKIIKSGTIADYDLELDPKNTYLSVVLKQYFTCFLDNTIESSPIEPQLKAERQMELISIYTLGLLKRQKPLEMVICEEQLNKSLPSDDRFLEFSESDITFSFLETFGTLHLCGFITITDIYYRHQDKVNQHWYLAVNFRINTQPSFWKVDEVRKRLLGITTPIPSLNVNNDFSYNNGQLHFVLIDGTPKSVDFSRAEEQRKIFEAFWYLWIMDNKREHTPAEITNAYHHQNRETLSESVIGEKVVNARKKINDLVPNRVIWHFEKTTGDWIFEVLPLNK